MKRSYLLPITVLAACLKLAPVRAVKEPCSEPDVSVLPFCNTSLPSLDRAKDLVSRLTLEEKISQMMHIAPAIDRFHIDTYNWWSESLHGISSKCTEDGRCATSYPNPINIGATFNMPLVKKMASQISSEGRRLFVDFFGGPANTRLTGLDFWGPNINIFRDPRWGRGMETPGEDPFLTGQYAVMYAKGMQEGADPRYMKTISTLKHYAAYSLENWGGTDRHRFNAVISDEDLVQTYLPAFEAGIKEGRAGSVMCSFNAVNGVPTCASAFLLSDILRKEWDWHGYVVSDCDAIEDVFKYHKYKNTSAEGVAVSIKAGTDLNCGDSYKYAADAIHAGFLNENDIDTALARLFQARFKLGMFDPWDQQIYMKYPRETVGHADHIETALQIARESIVLLKNENDALPLDPKSIKKIAVLGPHFNATDALCGNYHGYLPPIVSPIQALRNIFTSSDQEVRGMEGCEVNSTSTDDFDTAIKMASTSDVAILFMGLNTSIEREATDRVDIGFPGNQEDFIKAISQVQKKTILVVMNGGAVDISAAVANPNVVAILEAFYPGMKGSEAIADVLLGKYNPSGRLPYTVHKKDFVNQMSFLDMSMTNYPGRTYRFFRGDVVFPFGFGLSYTTFTYETEQFGARSPDSGSTSYRVRVTNTGTVAGDTSVLGFLKYGGSTKDFSCPQSQLFGFEKLHLEVNETKEIFLTASPMDLRCVKKASSQLVSPTGWYSVQIGEDQHHFLHSGEDLRDA